MRHCHGVRIAEAKRSRHQYQEQRPLRICLSRVTSFGGARACVFTLSPTTPLDATMKTALATVKLVSTEPRRAKEDGDVNDTMYKSQSREIGRAACRGRVE